MAPFRFNQKDLNVLATQSSEKFHKEGILLFKEKEGKIFNKSEVFTERFFRLYGNLLFYFKGTNQNTECSGVIVLENFLVIPDPSAARDFTFIIEFEKSDEQKYEFAAKNQKDYTDWMAIIKTSSYERMRHRLETLRTQILQITGVDPLPDDNNDDFPQSLEEPASYEDVLMEMCLGCNNLSVEGQVCAMIRVSTASPPETEWMKLSQTEICEESSNPNFLRTILISKRFNPITRLKFVVYNVINRAKSDVVVIGQSICTIQEIQNAANWKIILSIKNIDTLVGTLTIQGWQREVKHPFRERGLTMKQDGSPLQENQVRSFVTNIVQRSFHVPTSLDGEVKETKFQDLLAESLLCFKIPKLLLSLFVAEEKDSVMELHDMGELHPEWTRVKDMVQNTHFDFVHQYSSSLADLHQFEEESNFKRSVDKGDKKLEFIPTNLHLQRQCVIESNSEEFLYDTVTVGAPTAFNLKYKHGGLRRMIKSCEDSSRKPSCSEEEKRKAWYHKAANLHGVMKTKKEHMMPLLKSVRSAIENEDSHLLNETSAQLSYKLGDLFKVQSSSFVVEADKQLQRARTMGPSLRIDRVEISTDIDDPNYKSLEWEWTGTEFKPTRNPVKQESDCGVREALLKFMSAVNQTKIDEGFSNRNDLLAMIVELETAIKSCLRKICILMRFILMQEEIEYVGLKDIRYRRDVVFSQALTPLVSGFMLMLSRRSQDKQFLNQLVHCGLLVHFESLLSTYGDEMGMIEDMTVGVQDLKDVKLKIVPKDGEAFPVIRGKRSSMVVEIPVQSRYFNTLPKELQEKLITIHPMLFTMGINEAATLAEKFGDTTLQENINIENFYALENYHTLFKAFAPDHVGTRNQKAHQLSSLLDQLKTTVNAKKYKDVDVFTITEEICKRMNALRLTSCKSAKDRTAMAVTLEFVRSLIREHGMDESQLQSVLDSLRSQGTRLINSHKNVGLSKYAFNLVQVKALPSLYRPPEGTTGKTIQT